MYVIRVLVVLCICSLAPFAYADDAAAAVDSTAIPAGRRCSTDSDCQENMRCFKSGAGEGCFCSNNTDDSNACQPEGEN